METAPEGFGDDGIGTELASLGRMRRARDRDRGKDDDLGTRLQLGVAQELKPIHLRHLDIQQDQFQVRMLA